MKKKDIILLSVIIAASLLCLLGFQIFSNIKQATTVVVTINGETIAEFPLDKDIEYTILSPNGGNNLLIIKDGKAYISEATCPDKVCVNMGAVNEIKPISCVPNGVVVSLEER